MVAKAKKPPAKSRAVVAGQSPLGERLAKLRTQAGLSQAELATKAGVLLGRVAHIEQGVSSDPKLSTVCKLADALGVKLDALRLF